MDFTHAFCPTCFEQRFGPLDEDDVDPAATTPAAPEHGETSLQRVRGSPARIEALPPGLGGCG